MKQWITPLLALLLIGSAALSGWLFSTKKEAQRQLAAVQQNLDRQQAEARQQNDLARQKEADAQAALSAARDKLKVHESRAAQIAAQVESLQARVTDLAQTLQAKDRNLARQGAQRAQMQTQIQDLQNRAQTLMQSLHIKDQDLARLRAEREALATLNETLKTQLAEEINARRATVRSQADQVQITLLDQIVFESAQTAISDTGRAKLDKIARALKAVPGGQVRVIGHTDNIPINPAWKYKYPSNWELSATRAATVVRYFVDQAGLDPRRIQVVGFASHRPLTDNRSEDGRRQNRRVEIVLEGDRP